MDMNRLNKGEQIFTGASGLLFILAWVPMWAKYKAGPLSESFNAWQSYGFLGKLVVLLALAGLVIGGLKAAGQQVNVPAVALVGIGAVAALLMLLMLVTGPADEGFSGIFGFEANRGLLLFVGVVVGAAMAYGGYMAMQAEGTAGSGPAAPPPM